MKKNRKRNPWAAVRRCFGIILILAGLCFYLYPVVSEILLAYRTSVAVREFREKYGISDTDSLTATETEEETVYAVKNDETAVSGEEKDLLYQACFAYNCRIYAASQSGLKDVESYEIYDLGEEAMELLDDGLFGYIEIPAMDVTLPLYLGSSVEHMAAGAAVLGETSAPIGGLNTNAVISGHRGYRGSPYFREIEKLAIGDEVYITNPWGTLTYTVTEIDIINPSDADAVKIQEGRDMITLLTCHPYRSGGQYRYVVYCDRADAEGSGDNTNFADRGKDGSEKTADGSEGVIQAEMESGEVSVSDKLPTDTVTGESLDIDEDTGETGKKYIVASDGTIYALSEKDIRAERLLWLVSGVFLVGLLIFFVFSKKRER
ncbi:MAG: class C sortase [Lachnospiraceae bacterium]|nr:class C sortase [Lachnospiraceae bacterium]